MASTKADPAKEQEPADADDESVFTDSEEEEGELQLGRRDVASDDEGDAEEGEIRGAQAAASAEIQAERLAKVTLGDRTDDDEGPDALQPIQGDLDGYESEVEEDAVEGPGQESFQEQKVERRKAEPYDVPTSGAFWMHDDRMDDEEFAAAGRGAPQQKKKLFDPEASDDVWKHDRFEMLDLPPEEDDYRGFLASGRRGRGRRGGRGSRGAGRPGVNPPPGYENGFAAGAGADSSAQYDDEDGAYARAPAYAEQPDGRGRGRAGRGRGRARSAVPINGQQAGDGYGDEGRGSRGGRGRRGGRGAAYVNGSNGFGADVSSSGRGRGRSSGARSRQQGGDGLGPDEWPSLPGQSSSQGASLLNVGARDYMPGDSSSKPSGRDSGRLLQPSAAPFAPPASALPDPQAFIPGPLQASEGGALQPPVRRPVSIQDPSDGSQPMAAGSGGRGRGSRRYTAAGGVAAN
ncbi:g5862 [Coccomyxa viridis]|uniref:G5862 protein n=1 Tax=Coccomyxa viridis TaxID=1274662 RepID=A0ABP1FTX0_9CHLO